MNSSQMQVLWWLIGIATVANTLTYVVNLATVRDREIKATCKMIYGILAFGALFGLLGELAL